MKTRPRVARIPYLNAAPYYVEWDRLDGLSGTGWDQLQMPPRQLGVAMERGDVDAGLMAVADLNRMSGDFEPLLLSGPEGWSSLGIANRDRVDSVLLFVRDEEGGRTLGGRRPHLDLDRQDAERLNGVVIGVTGETSTSYRLLRLVLEVRHGIRPSAYRRLDLAHVLDPSLNAVLLIGDLALKWRYHTPSGWVQAMDLAREWWTWTDRPFVFARWAVRRGLPEAIKLDLARFLDRSLEEGLADLPGIAQRMTAGTELKAEHLLDYLENFTYRLGAEELEAEARFRELLADNEIPCTAD